MYIWRVPESKVLALRGFHLYQYPVSYRPSTQLSRIGDDAIVATTYRPQPELVCMEVTHVDTLAIATCYQTPVFYW